MPESTGGCARDYAESARKLLTSQLVEIERIAVDEYLIDRKILSYKAFQDAVAKDFGELSRPYALSLWQAASASYVRYVASNPGLDLPPIELLPPDFVPDYYNLNNLSDTEAGKYAVQNLVDLAKVGALKGFRGDYDVKPLADSDKIARQSIDKPEVLEAISRQFDIPFDDVVNAQRLMMDALIYEQREKNILVQAAQEELADLQSREKLVKGSTGGAFERAVQALGEIVTEAGMVADMARFYTGLSQGNLSAAGRALRMARETAMLRKSGASGEAFVTLMGNAGMSQPLKLKTEEGEILSPEDALKVAAEVTPEKAAAQVEKAKADRVAKRAAKEERVSKTGDKRQDNRISGRLGASDLFGDSMPFAPLTQAERKQSVTSAKRALRKAGATASKLENTDALNRLAERAKRLKALIGKQEGAC
jgi:hypothetical protein